MLNPSDVLTILEQGAFMPSVQAMSTNYQDRKYHFTGEYPEKLLNTFRPNEEEWQKDYRRNNFKAKNKSLIEKLISLFQKIGQNNDWRISFEDDFQKTGVNPEMLSVENLLTQEIPHFKSLENFLFDYLLKLWMEDPGALLLPMVDNPTKILTFYSPNVLYRYEENFVVQKSVGYLPETGKPGVEVYAGGKGYLYVFFKKEGKKQAGRDEYQLRQEYILEGNPFVEVGSIVDYFDEYNQPIYKSLIDPIVPDLNDLVERNSDLGVIWAMHAHPKHWQVSTHECSNCKGTGYDRKRSNEICNTCKGSGQQVESPFNVLIYGQPKSTVDATTPIQLPNPPAGYVERPVELIDKFTQAVEQAGFNALSMLNLEYLVKVGMNQSGKAKEYDRQDINALFYNVAFYLASKYSEIATVIVLRTIPGLRDPEMMPYISNEQLSNLLPNVSIPESFDVITMEAASEAYSQAIKDNHSPIIVRQRERDLVMKLYGTNEQVEDVVKLTELIDPLPFSQEVKTLVYNNRGCTQFDYILSTNLHKYINMVLKDYTENDIEESEIIESVKALANADMAIINQANVALFE
jgi:hypothetical protein